MGTGSPQTHAQIPARGTHGAQVCLPAHAHIRIYIRACTTTDVHTCSQAPSCPYSHVADSRAHTLMHDKRASCIITSPHSSRAGQSWALPMQAHKATGRTTTHTHAVARRHALMHWRRLTGTAIYLQMLTCTNTTRAHSSLHTCSDAP